MTAEVSSPDRSPTFTVLLILVWVTLLANIGYDVYGRYFPPPEQIEATGIFKGWGGTVGQCTAIINGVALIELETSHHLLRTCGINDSTTDRFEDRRVAISGPFTITNGDIQITIPYSKGMIQTAHDQVAALRSPAGAGSSSAALAIQFPLWLQAALIPNNCDVSTLQRLSDIQRCGGRLLKQVAGGASVIPAN